MKDIDTLVDDLYNLITEGIRHNYEYRQLNAMLGQALGDLLNEQRIDSPYESYLKYVLENIEEIEESYMIPNIKNDALINHLHNAIDNREFQAVRLACEAGILCGINYCKNRGFKGVKGE